MLVCKVVGAGGLGCFYIRTPGSMGRCIRLYRGGGEGRLILAVGVEYCCLVAVYDRVASYLGWVSCGMTRDTVRWWNRGRGVVRSLAVFTV